MEENESNSGSYIHFHRILIIKNVKFPHYTPSSHREGEEIHLSPYSIPALERAG